MKKSQYIYIFHEGNYSYWFNGLTKFFFRTSEGLGKKLEKLLDNSSLLEHVVPEFYDKLIKGGFLIESDVNEIEIIRNYNDREVNRKDYTLMILPTLNCNFKCWYCVQDHIPSKMDNITMERIKKHLRYIIKEEKIESLILSWFGGEPFLYFNEVIKPLSEYAIALCNEAGIPFSNTATSNGALINEKVIEELDRLNFTFFQITLDGVKNEHDKVKYSNARSSAYEETLTNINNILSKTDKSRVTLRINYTYDKLNNEIVEQINNYIEKNNRHKISVLLKKVCQVEADSSQFPRYISLLDKFYESGYGVSYLDVIYNFIPCYVNRRYFNTINYNGKVIKCTANNDMYSNTTPGRLCDDGTITWIDGYLDKIHERSFENKQCLSCKYLPICMGNCPRQHYEKVDSCLFGKFGIDYKEAIKAYIDKNIDNSVNVDLNKKH